MNKAIIAFLSAIFANVIAPNANAVSVVLGPVAVDVSAPDPDPLYAYPNNVINQSGLSSEYVSGVTDFNSFVESTTSSYIIGYPGLGVGGVDGLGSFYFDLGQIAQVNAVATWGQDCCQATMTNYNLYSSDTFGSGGSRNFIGSFSAGYSPSAYDHSFSSVYAQFFEIDVVSNLGWHATRFNEIVFGGSTSVQPVPIPAAAWLLASSLSGLVYVARSRRSAA